jgi:hypothetical protein
MWPFITTPAEAVEFIMMVLGVLFGVSHIVRPQMWADFFTSLHAEGTKGLILKTFALELWPATLIVTLHQVWSGPGIVLTLYGWAQMTKVVIAMLVPQITMRGMAMAAAGPRAFIPAGVMLMALGIVSGLALFWPD